MKTSRILAPTALCLFMLACGDAADPEDVDASDAGEVEQRDAGGEVCTHPMSQGLSEPCCLEHGVDACGANLFCAAFDGRTQPTCYPERSRVDQATCTADLQCVSGSCNTTARACISLPGTKCTAATGCADDPSGQRYGCNVSGNSTCKSVGDGEGGDFCLEDGDCLDRHCADYACKASIGSSCDDGEDCLAGVCAQCSLSSVRCMDPYHYRECLTACRTSGGGAYYAVNCE